MQMTIVSDKSSRSHRFHEALSSFKAREGSVTASASTLHRPSNSYPRSSAFQAGKFPFSTDPFSNSRSGSLRATVVPLGQDVKSKKTNLAVGASSSATLIARQSLERETAEVSNAGSGQPDQPISSLVSGDTGSYGHAESGASNGGYSNDGSHEALFNKSAMETQLTSSKPASGRGSENCNISSIYKTEIETTVMLSRNGPQPQQSQSQVQSMIQAPQQQQSQSERLVQQLQPQPESEPPVPKKHVYTWTTLNPHEPGKFTLVMPKFKPLERTIPMQRKQGPKTYSALRRTLEIPFQKHFLTRWLKGRKSPLKHDPVAFAKEKTMFDRMLFRVDVSVPIRREEIAQGLPKVPMRDAAVLPAITLDIKRMQVMMAFCARDTEYARRLMRKDYHSSVRVRAAHARHLLAQCTAMHGFLDFHGTAAYLVALALEVGTSYLPVDIFTPEQAAEFARLKAIYLHGPQSLLARYAELRRDGTPYIPFMQPMIAEMTAVKESVAMLGTPPLCSNNDDTSDKKDHVPIEWEIRIDEARSALMAHRSNIRKQMDPLLRSSNAKMAGQIDMLLWSYWSIVEQSPLLT